MGPGGSSLHVMCDARTCNVSTQTYRPLPTVELYDPAAPQRGLLALLKHALWQTLWVDNGPPSGAALHWACCCESL